MSAHAHQHDHDSGHDHSHGHGHSHSDASDPHGYGDFGDDYDAEAEAEHLQKVLSAFLHYKEDVDSSISRAESDFLMLPQRHRDMVPQFETRMKSLRAAVDANQAFIEDMCAPHQIFANGGPHTHTTKAAATATPLQFDMDKVRSTIKQFVRDWSSEGEEERKVCYGPFLDELARRYPKGSRQGVSVLVPGAGLGRLAFEFARMGMLGKKGGPALVNCLTARLPESRFDCQGNEFSYFMLIASNYILNRMELELAPLHPWVHSFCNHYAAGDQARAVLVPDVHPANELVGGANFSMAAGDFLECYTEPDIWDAVCTCFFMDTAKDIIAYIETIWNTLKPGGVWINFGPLLFHFAEMSDPSLELSHEEIMDIVRQVGFTVEREEKHIKAPYINNSRSMYNVAYDCVFYVCTKPALGNAQEH